MRTIVLNSNNVVAGTNNSVYRYSFPGGAAPFKDQQVAIGSIQIYYSWFNLTAAQFNTTFSYVWPLPSPQTYTVTVPDGFYDIPTLNSYFQTVMVQNGQYLMDSEGNQIFYLELKTNSTYYAVMINSYQLPTSATASSAGYTAPSNWPGYATSTVSPQFSVLSNNFTLIVGLTAGLYPSNPASTTTSQLSSFTPQVSPVQSVLVGVSLCKNPSSNPSNILYSFSSANTTFGSLISSTPPALSWVDVQDGLYANFDVSLTDQNFKPLVINDNNLVIMLLVKDKSSLT